MELTPEGIAIIENDTHLSKWIRQEKRLDIRRERELVQLTGFDFHPDMTVIDVGASLGAHSAIYAPKVKHVFAFEPNPVALTCLRHNMQAYPNVYIYPIALGDTPGRCSVYPDMLCPLNYGMTTVGVGEDIPLSRFDDTYIIGGVDFMKLDCEGSELKVLRGAEATITRDHPTLLIEINQYALGLHDTTPEAVYRWLAARGYVFRPISGRSLYAETRMNEPEIDVVCRPIKSAPPGFLQFKSL